VSVRRTIRGVWLGRCAYQQAHELQQQLAAARQQGRIGDSVLLLEHEPVITLGRGAKPEHVVADLAELERAGVPVVVTGRGGDVTLHAPGQLVCYPILDLAPDRRDVRRYVRSLGEVMRRVVAAYGIEAGFVDPHIGLWVDRARVGAWPGASEAADLAKIGAIGVRLSRWITMHGFALNLSTDLELYRWIVPCGIRTHGVTSVQALTGLTPDVRSASELALGIMGQVFDADVAPLRDDSARELAQISFE
jgi:lipoyl(octanoyl) transferase